MRRKALFVALSRKFKDGEIVFMDSLSFKVPKAKQALAFLSALKISRKRNAALVALPAAHMPTARSFSNFGNVAVEDVRNLNPVSVFSKKQLIIADPKIAIDIFSKKI